VLAWVAVLGAVVGIALTGGSRSVPTERDAPSLAARATEAVPSPRQEVAVSTREVVVRGRVPESLGVVRIVLQAASGEAIATAPLDPTGHGHGAWVPFESRFSLTPPPPGGAWPSFIVAVDAAGRPIDETRHPFTVRSYVYIPEETGPRIPAGAAGTLHTTGEDGLMGGIPFGTNFLPPPDR
jgi:hypothetical protein